MRKSKDTLNSPGHVKQEKKNILHNVYVLENENVLGEIKRKQRHCVKLHHTEDIFAFLP